MNLTLVVLGRTHEDIDGFDRSNVPDDCEVVFVTNPDGALGGLGHIANRYLRDSVAMVHGSSDRGRLTEVVGIVHADVQLGPRMIESLFVVARSGAISGIVGVNMRSEYIWCNGRSAPEPVSTLDSCAVFILRDAGIFFDTDTFDGFHCCVEDLCLQGAAAGMPILVAPGAASHAGNAKNDPVATARWMNEYGRYRGKLSDKWRPLEFRTT